jgi:hypothetical protein
MDLYTAHRFNCSGADLDLCSYGGVTVTTEHAKVELAKLTQEQLQAAILSFVRNQSWRERDSKQPDDFLEALIAKATETIRERQEYREKQASA